MLNSFSHQNTRKLKNVVASKLLGELMTVLGVKIEGGVWGGESKSQHTNEKGPVLQRDYMA